MVRQALRYQVLDSSGVPIAGASIKVAQLGTTTDITQTMYIGLTGVTPIANPLTTDASGRVQAYLDGEDAVALLRVTMIPTLTGFTFTSRDVQLGSDYGVLDAGDVPIKGLTVDAKDRFNMARTDAGDPTSLVVGDMWYNTATNALHWEDNTGTQTVSSTTGDVTDVVAGDGLSGVESPAGVITLDVVAGNAINVDATDVEVDVNAATSAAAALDGTDKILISDTDDANTTKSATISQIDPTMLDGTANQVYFSNSTGNVTGLTLGASGTVLTSAGATSDPTFGTAATVGANKSLYTNNSDVESGLAFGAAGTVLTSGGTDATATPPTWEAAGGGAEGSFVANGSIAAGHAVVLDTAGTVSQVVNTLIGNAVGDGSTLNSSQGFWGYSWGMSASAGTGYYDKSCDLHIHWQANYQYPSTPYYGGWAYGGFATNSSDLTTAFTVAKTQTTQFAGNTGSEGPMSWYDDTAEIGYTGGSNGNIGLYGYVNPVACDGTTITFGTTTQFSDNTATKAKCGLYVPDLGYSLIFWQNAAGTYYTDIENASAGSTTITLGGNIATTQLDGTGHTTTEGAIKATYDPTRNLITVVWGVGGGAVGVKYLCGTVSGGSISWGSVGDVQTSIRNNYNLNLCYRSADDRWFVQFTDSPDVNYTVCGTFGSGTTITWAMYTFTLLDDGTDFFKGYSPFTNSLDDGLPTVTQMSKDYNNYKKSRIFAFQLNSAGEYRAAVTPTTPMLPSGSSGLVNFNQASNGSFTLSYSPDSGKYFWNGWAYASPYYMQGGAYQPTSGTDNGAGFIGIAQSTVTNGQSVNVKWLSSKDTQQSGLSIAAKVYADSSGAITSTVGTNTHIGFATSATDVIITETGSNF